MLLSKTTAITEEDIILDLLVFSTDLIDDGNLDKAKNILEQKFASKQITRKQYTTLKQKLEVRISG